MMDVLLVVLILVGLLAVGLLAALWLRLKRGGADAAEAAAQADLLRERVAALEAEAADLRTRLDTERGARVQAETRLEAERENLAEQRRLLEEAETRLKEAFEALSARALKEGREQFLAEAQRRLEPIRDLLDAYQRRLQEVEKARNDAYGGLRQYLEGLKEAQLRLQDQTTRLETALRGSARARGRWGEVTLRNVIEAAGMTAYCDYEEQASTSTEDGRIRPDVIVHLPNDRIIVIDAKAPLDAYMEALDAGDEAARRAAMARHAQALRSHVQALCRKAYWAQFENTPDFVVLFVPGESFFSAALEADRALMEDAFRSNVILASPATLMALLRAVAAGWREHDLAENAARIADAGRDLYDRIRVFAEHLVKVGDGLRRAAQAYDRAVGSYQRNLEPGARRLADLGATTGRDLPEVAETEGPTRRLPLPAARREEAAEEEAG